MLEQVHPKGCFKSMIETHQLSDQRKQLKTLQLNLGKKCNQICSHCHVDASPNRTEMMSLETIEQILKVLQKSPEIKTVDLTGGAPELNPHFKYLVSRLHDMGINIIDRCNLTVLFEAGQEDTAAFLARHQVQIVASLPCYLESNVNAQRGDNVYRMSIEALKMLNELGYGKKDSGLSLNLVFNPGGASLPPAQSSLEMDYKAKLREDHGIEFNQLLTITNMPIKRFRQHLKKIGKLDSYEGLLVEKFNPEAAKHMMCRELISISWEGKFYDCDFNQALDIPVQSMRSIWEIDSFKEVDDKIVLKNHCFACTAGSGSSCSGALL